MNTKTFDEFVLIIREALETINFRLDTIDTPTLTESSISRIFSHASNRAIGIISAERSGHTPEENNKRTENLKKDLSMSGYGYVHGRGGYVEEHGTPNAQDVSGEKSFILIGPKTDDGGKFLNHIKHLGRKYGQESILHKPSDSEVASWHYTVGANAGKVEPVGSIHHDDTAMYYTAISGGKKKFSFVNK